jgi:hypothetical protein
MKQKLALLVATAALLITLGFTMKSNKMTADSDLKQVLLAQLKTTHNQKDWFVPANVAVEGLTAEQAMWKDKSNHSVAQLTHHIIFWNEQQVAKFKGLKPPAFSGNNEETFTGLDKESWADAVKRLDRVMVDLETAIQGATEAQLKEWAPTIANISTHNAYHTGQIVVVRKLQGSWDAEKGVK